ncbi:MAG: hypothetical protein MI923_26550 [Phycisphaerales bacterium]|nr:hypothetical protein [Phycisphaerales bacterium]
MSLTNRLTLSVVLFSMSLTGCQQLSSMSSRERSRLSQERDESGTVRLVGIGPIRGFAKDRDHTLMHCLELVLEAMGREIGYDELMGMSGMAFRLQFRVDRWGVGNPDPLVGENCVDVLMSAIGLKHEVLIVERNELAEAAALRRRIKESIDLEIPVLAANIIEPEDWGIITGYRPDFKWLCRSYNGGALESDRMASGWPTAVILFEKQSRPPANQAYLASVRRAVDLFEKRRSGSYALGEKAFDYWCQSLQTVQTRQYIHPNVWTYIALMDARASAARYFRRISLEFGANEHYALQAADYYDQEVRLLRDGYQYVPSEKDYPGTLPPPHFRQRQIEVLRKAKELEKNAIDALRKLL